MRRIIAFTLALFLAVPAYCYTTPDRNYEIDRMIQRLNYEMKPYRGPNWLGATFNAGMTYYAYRSGRRTDAGQVRDFCNFAAVLFGINTLFKLVGY